MTTSVSAQGLCVVENGGCRDAQTGKLYVPDGNKLVDPETKQVYLENQEVRSSIKGGVNVIRPSDAVTSRFEASAAREQAMRDASTMADMAVRNYKESRGQFSPGLNTSGIYQGVPESGKRLHEQAKRGDEDNNRAVITPVTAIPPAYPQPMPSVITNCDGAGCWDNLGGRYNKGAGNTYFGPSGACQSIGGMMHCP